MTKRCKDCGVIFETEDESVERCCLCEDDREDEEDADSDYAKNWYRIRRYGRRYVNMKPGIVKCIMGLLVRAMNWANENIRGCENG